MYRGDIIKIESNNYIKKDLFIGSGYPTCVIANIGTSTHEDNFEQELIKANIAIKAGANIITDHSVVGNIKEFHDLLRKNINVPISAIPAYEMASKYEYSGLNKFGGNQVLELIEEELERGINLLTLHATILKEDICNPIFKNRIIPLTSKGGLMMVNHMKKNMCENPFYEFFSDILKIFKKHKGVISLGTTYRPASICDAVLDENDCYWIEMKRMQKLVIQALKAEVPIMVEGIGHAKLSDIPKIISKSKEICKNVPYRVLTVPTDIAFGYDNISSAIASATAALYGADIISAVSAAEHVGLPDIEQIEMAVISAKIAGHCADICTIKDVERDKRMSEARNATGGCMGIIESAIYPLGAKNELKKQKKHVGRGCNMCGDFCALANKDKLFDFNNKET